MAQHSTRLARRVLASNSYPSVTPSSSLSVRAFSHTTSQRKTPSLAEVESNNGPAFENAQKEFRERLAANKAQQDREAREAARKEHANATSQTEENGQKERRRQSMVSRLIHGTEEGRLHEKELERSFSQVLARGKYVHSITFHEVKPDKVDEYVDLIGKFYPRAAADPQNKVKLVGSWRTEIGDSDTFVHIWEYERYHGFHDSLHTIATHPDFAEYDHKVKSLINSKKISLMQEFSFWPTSSPRKLGGLFELRSYKLHPGNLLEWETHWRQGLEARRQVMEGVGAWFVQIGDLNTVHHLWQFANLEERKVRREQSWAVEGWSDTVHRTVPLIQEMQSRVLVPCEWSPVQ